MKTEQMTTANNKNNVFTRWNDKRRIGTHQVAIIPRYLPLHHGDCPCGLGWSHLLTKQQWRALKAHPMPAPPTKK